MTLQLNPTVITSTDLLTLHDQHTVAEQHAVPGITPETLSTYTIPASGIVSLREQPKQEQTTVPTGVTVTQVPGGPFTEVLASPAVGQFVVNYTNGTVIFNTADAGTNVLVSYTALGSIVKARDVNNISTPFVPFYNKLNGIVPDGGTDFTFPANVTVTGNLDVVGVINRVASEVLDLTDSILLLNQSQDGPVLSTVGLEVSLSGNAQGSPTNPQFVWDIPSSTWNFYSTSSGPTGSAGYALFRVYNKGGVQVTKLSTVEETTLVATLVSGDAGLQWFNTDDNQFKGWNGTAMVVLG